MAESLVETPKLENKMSDSVTYVPCLQESVSFGRFEHDSLCWERWSAFPTNKYLEEVEKCSTPGSVAQKKAYFEAHYKKIAARKAELLEEEKRREAESVTEDRASIREEDLDVEKSSALNCDDGTELVNDEADDLTGEVSDKHIDIPINSTDVIIEENEVASLTSEVTEHIDELSDCAHVTDEGNEVADPMGEHIDLLSVEADVREETKDIEPEHVDVLSVEADVSEETKDIQPEHIDVLSFEADVCEETKDIQPEHIDEMNHSTDKMQENYDLEPQLENANEALNSKMEIPELLVEPVMVKEDLTSSGVWQDKEVLPQEKIEEREIAQGHTKKPVEFVDPTKIKKPTLVKKATNSANAKKKPASPIPKKTAALTPRSPMISTPKSGKPELTKTAKSTNRPALKKETGYTPQTSKKSTKPETKRVLPTSLHMSLSYGPTNSEPASLTTMRKSLIMERMGDKDIVKRAFKAFQNVSGSPSSIAKSTATPQTTNKRIEPKVSTPDSLHKKEGITRAAKATSPSIGQQGTRKTTQSLGSKKSIGVDQRNDKAVSASFGSRSLDFGRQQKQVSKKVELKTNVKDAGKTQLQSKVKAEKAAEIGKPSHKINTKTKLSSSYNQGHGFLRGSVRKVDAKI